MALLTSTLVVILLGPPGAGKGTQAAQLKAAIGLPHISTGDLLRHNISQKNHLGNLAKTYIDKGELVPDHLILDMLFDRVAEKDCHKGFILDGFPRTLPQAAAFDKRLGDGDRLCALNLKLDDAEILKRISGRLLCKECQKPYNSHFVQPKIEGQCDECSGELYQRPDDRESIVLERLSIYHRQTAPLIQYYESKGLLAHVECHRPKELIFNEILNNLETFKSK